MSGNRLKAKALIGLSVVTLTLGLWAAPASAHAELLETEPANGQQLDEPPGQVVLIFSEGVDPPGDAIEVFDSSGDQVDVGDPTHPDGDTTRVAVSLPDLDDGAFVVTWRVSSADSHPIRGGFTFRVGEAGSAAGAEAEALMDRLVAGEGGDTLVGLGYGAVRFGAFVGMILLVGGGLFLVVLWPDGFADRRVRRLLTGGWWLVLVMTVLGLGLQGAYTAGEAIDSTVDPEVLGDVLGTRTGRVWLIRLAGLVVVALAARWLRRALGPEPDRPNAREGTDDGPQPGLAALPARWTDASAAVVVALVLGVGLLATISFAGHAASGDLVPLALLVDVVHLAAVSLWLGGLALLVAVVLRPDPDRAGASADSTAGAALEPVVRGFSVLAFASVVTLVVTGTIQGIRQTQGIDALFDTTYGRLLLVKVGLVAVMVAVAAASRSWVRRRWAPAGVPVGADGGGAGLSIGPGAKAVTEVPAGSEISAGDTTRPRLSSLRRSVGIEAAIAAVILAATALLVNTVPGADAVTSEFAAELHGSTVLVRLEVDPAAAGPSEVRLEVLSHAGEPVAAEEVTADLALPSRDIGPIPLTLEPSGTSTYVSRDLDIPFAGTWELTVKVRTSEFDQDEIKAQLPVD